MVRVWMPDHMRKKIMNTFLKGRRFVTINLLATSLLLALAPVDVSLSATKQGMLINVQTGKCLTIAGGRSTENNVNALQFTCDSDPSRRWFILETGDAVQIKNVQTGKCLTIAGGRSTENNVNALQFTCDSDPSRRWRMKSVGGVFQIENVQTGKCLTIAGGRSTENNVDALQFTCDSDPSRTWRFQSGQPID